MKQSFGLRKTTAAFALMLSISLISAYFIAAPTAANAQTAISQCNGIDNQGGREVRCSYTVTNNLTGDQMSSTVELTICTGFANDEPTMVCITPPPVTSPTLVTAIDQCNGSGAEGGVVTCSVTVINNITSTETPLPATVNQCIDSGTGGGTEPTTVCDPVQNTTNATITQCNGSGNGGGGTMRVRCTVDSASTTTAALTVTINQCNGSGNGGGSVVECFASITNNMTAPAAPPAPPDDDEDDDGGGGGSGSSGGNGSGGSIRPTPSPSSTPTPSATPSATPTPPAGPSGEDGGVGVPAPDATSTPQPPASPVRPAIPRRGMANAAPGNGDGPGGGTNGSGTLTNTGLGTRGASSSGDAGEITTNQISRIPRGGAATGGGSSDGFENLYLLVVGLVLMTGSLPALFVRRRVGVKA